MTGTWAETTLNNYTGVLLHSSDAGVPPHKTFPVRCTHVTANSLTMTVKGTFEATYKVTLTGSFWSGSGELGVVAGLQLMYEPPGGGGNGGYNFGRVTSTQPYELAVSGMKEADSGQPQLNLVRP